MTYQARQLLARVASGFYEEGNHNPLAVLVETAVSEFRQCITDSLINGPIIFINTESDWLSARQKTGSLLKDSGTAVAWYRKAAKQDCAAAQYNLGRAYAHGMGVPKDHKLASLWLTKAAEQGYVGVTSVLETLDHR